MDWRAQEGEGFGERGMVSKSLGFIRLNHQTDYLLKWVGLDIPEMNSRVICNLCFWAVFFWYGVPGWLCRLNVQLLISLPVMISS